MIEPFQKSGANVVALSDSNRKRLALLSAMVPKASTYTDYRELLTDIAVDAVYIATPPPTHFEIARDCLSAGKHVFVEKPLATNASDAKILLALSKKNQRVLMVGHSMVFNNALRLARDLIEQGEIGDLRLISFVMTNPIDIWAGKRIDSYSSIIWDLGPHAVSAVRFLAGANPTIATTTLVSSAITQEGMIRDVVQFKLEFAGGFLGLCDLKWFDFIRNRGVTVTGTSGILGCGDPTVRNDTSITTRKFKLSDKKIELSSDATRKVYVGDTLENECEHFVESVLTGAKPLASAQDGCDVVAILSAITDSITSGKPERVVYR